MSSQTVRRYIITASVAAITVTGAWYGAGLKTRQEFKQEKQEAIQISPQEKIEQLEAMKARLLHQKTELQSKIDRLTVDAASPTGTTKQQAG